MNPERRSVLTAASAVAGLSLCALGGERALALALSAPPRGAEPAAGGELLDSHALADLAALAAQLIPTTATPGAVDVNAHVVVDRLLARCQSTSQQQQVIRLLRRLRGAAGDLHGGGAFHQLPGVAQGDLLHRLEQAAAPFVEEDRAGWRYLKSLLVFAYCTSEAGATQLLAYDPVPGDYRGSVPYARVGKAWFK